MLTDEQANQLKKQLLEQVKSLPSEQQEAVRKQIESMNNEQLEAFIQRVSQQPTTNENKAKTCFFCEVAKGNVEVVKIYEDKDVIAFLDINPANEGHTILITKQHFSTMDELPEELVLKMFNAIKIITKAMKQFSTGFNIVIQQGQSAGQSVNHFSIHIIPRKEEDDAQVGWKRHKSEKQQLEDYAEKIRPLIEKTINEQKEVIEQQKQQAEEAKKETEGMAKLIKKRIP